MQKKSRILGPDGKPYDMPLNAEQTASLGWINQTFSSHPTRGLTPARLNQYLESAEQGNLRDMADLGRDIQERDGHIAAELGKRARAILTQSWTLIPPRNPSAEETKRTEAMQDWITDIPDIEDVFLDCLDAIGHGFAALELAWENNQTITLPKTITHRPQSWFQTPLYNGNDLRLIDGSADGAALWQYGWIIHKHRARSGWLNSSGLFRTLAWPYLLKAYALGDWGEFLEVYGQPIRVGEYHSGASDKEKNSLLQAVASMGHNAAGIISSDMKVTFHDAVDGQHEAFLAMVKYCESLCSKAILGATLTSGADGKSSTNALGNIHNEVRHDLMESDARQLSSTLSRHLVLPIYLLNTPGADPARAPRLKIITKQKQNLEAFANALPALVSIGMAIPQHWAHTELGIPVAKKGEAVLTLTSPAQTRPAAEQLSWRNLYQQAHTRAFAPALLTGQPTAPLAPGQAALDAIIGHTGQQDHSAALLALLQPAISAITNGADEESAAAALLAAQPDMADAALVEALTQAFYIADILGRIHADTV